MNSTEMGKPSRVVTNLPRSGMSPRLYTLLAVGEAFAAFVLLFLAAGMTLSTLSYLRWAIGNGSVPFYGMFMATLIRSIAALTLGIPGLLLAKTAHVCRGVATRYDETCAVKLQWLHRLTLFVVFGFALLCCFAMLAFFVALRYSPM